MLLSAQLLGVQLNTLLKVTLATVIDNIKISVAQENKFLAHVRNQCGVQAAFQHVTEESRCLPHILGLRRHGSQAFISSRLTRVGD